jgi:hypothetical protein
MRNPSAWYVRCGAAPAGLRRASLLQALFVALPVPGTSDLAPLRAIGDQPVGWFGIAATSARLWRLAIGCAHALILWAC